MKGFDKLPSTSDYIKEHLNELKNFDGVYTANQTAGRGRAGHTWEVEPGRNATFSILVKEEYIVKKFNIVSIITAIAVSNYLENIGMPNVQIKWPNDVLVDGKKICGILLEGKIPEYLIIGIGVNVNQTRFEGFEATSIKNILDLKIQPSLVAADINNLVLDYITDVGSDLSEYIDEYEEKDYLLDKEISFNYNGKPLEGTAKGINLDGSLKVLHNGEILNLTSDEVNLIKAK